MYTLVLSATFFCTMHGIRYTLTIKYGVLNILGLDGGAFVEY